MAFMGGSGGMFGQGNFGSFPGEDFASYGPAYGPAHDLFANFQSPICNLLLRPFLRVLLLQLWQHPSLQLRLLPPQLQNLESQ